MSHNTDFKTLKISAKDDCLYVFYRVNMRVRAGIMTKIVSRLAVVLILAIVIILISGAGLGS